MPEAKSIYDVYAGAGKSMGAYESSLRGVEDVWGDIQFKQARTAQRGERRERSLDTLLAATELGSTLYGGWQAQQEFKQETLPGMQKIAAKEAYSEGLGMEKGAKKWSEFRKTDPGKAFIEGYAPKQVGKGGKQWGEISAWEKMWQKPMYQFGEGEGAYTIGKSDITGITGMAKYGVESDISQYQEAISGGTATAGAKTKTPETKTPETKPATTLPTLEKKEEPVVAKEEPIVEAKPPVVTKADFLTKRETRKERKQSEVKFGGIGSFFGSKEYEIAFGEDEWQ